MFYLNRSLIFLIFFASSCSPFKENFHQVDEVYFRSGQLDKEMLEAKVREHEIKTLINLRGKAEGESFWEEESKAAKDLGIAYHNLLFYSYKYPLKGRVLELITLLEQVEYPILVHCNHGANRAGFAAAVYLLEIEKKPFSEAKKQLSIFYGHIPSKLDGFLSRYKRESDGRSMKQWLLDGE
ncbi:hypothetical protein SCG7109_BI_00020 [Chlamydiales bacterium SCGC AG-110-M15]|nr:hypothetical protein SCG7109_BI_00020 [Chlamydiales bacterium SCGC AG-110-M15]